MSDDWDDYAEDWDGDARVREYARQAFESLGQHVDLSGERWREGRVLDFGCGTGLLSEKLAPLVGHLVAVDTSAGMIEVLRAKSLANVTAICADLDNAAVRHKADWFGGFDLIVASSVMSFVPDYDAMAALLAAAMVPGGMYVQWDWLASDDAPNGLTEAQIENALRAAGLKSIRVEPAFSIDSGDGDLAVLMGMGTA